MSKDELRPAVEVWREAYWTWANDPSFGSTARSVSIIEADRAAVREAAERDTVARIVAWLRDVDDQSRGEFESAEALAERIKAGEWKQ